MKGLERNIDLLKYLTPVSRQNKDIQVVLASESVELQALWQELCNIFNEQFIKYMGDYGVSKWESVLGIIPAATSSLKSRKKWVAFCIKGRKPYTLKRLQQILNNTYGDAVSVSVSPDIYEICITLSNGYNGSVIKLLDFLETLIPKNLLIQATRIREIQCNTALGGVVGNHRIFMISQRTPSAHSFNAPTNYAGIHATAREIVIRQME